jgi:hypothetical protein
MMAMAAARLPVFALPWASLIVIVFTLNPCQYRVRPPRIEYARKE